MPIDATLQRLAAQPGCRLAVWLDAAAAAVGAFAPPGEDDDADLLAAAASDLLVPPVMATLVRLLGGGEEGGSDVEAQDILVRSSTVTHVFARSRPGETRVLASAWDAAVADQVALEATRGALAELARRV